MRNPFYHRQTIADPSCFHGRSGVVRNLLEMVASGQSCALVGERRLGKSSLLGYVADPRVQSAHGLDPRSTLTAGLDFLAYHRSSPEELWAEIAEALEAATDDERARALLAPLARRPLSFADLRRVLGKLGRAGFRVLLLCDEFELAVENPRFDLGFFGGLRSLAGGGRVVFVTASRLSLLELDQYQGEETRRKILGSPFFNIFAELVVGPFADHEMAEMLGAYLQQAPIRFEAEDVGWLDRTAGRHPYFLQLAAYHLYETRASAPAGRDRHEQHRRALAELRREAAKVFSSLWRNSSEAERSALRELVIGTASGPASADRATLERLERRGLVRGPQPPTAAADTPSSSDFELAGYRPFSEPFAEWIAAELAGG